MQLGQVVLRGTALNGTAFKHQFGAMLFARQWEHEYYSKFMPSVQLPTHLPGFNASPEVYATAS
eukprot:1625317-Pleurochrysis_carterae.AAC.3